MKKSIVIMLTGLVLTGCGHIRIGEPEFSENQLMANVQAVVLLDETYGSFAQSNFDRFAGAGPAEQHYRRIVLQIVNSEGGRPIGSFFGARNFEAMIPDGMTLLQKGDLVDVRATTFYDMVKNFGRTGEGSAVLRILCPSERMPSPEKAKRFKDCSGALPWFKPWGEEKRFYSGILASPSGHPFKISLKEYKELNFTPYYDDSGRKLASAIPIQARPDLLTWSTPSIPK